MDVVERLVQDKLTRSWCDSFVLNKNIEPEQLSQLLSLNKGELADLDNIKTINWFAKISSKLLKEHNFDIRLAEQANNRLVFQFELPDLPEIDVFVFDLYCDRLPLNLLNEIDCQLDKFCLFICHCQNQYCLIANYKQEAESYQSSRKRFNIQYGFQSYWFDNDELTLDIKGQTLVEAFSNLLVFIDQHQQKGLLDNTASPANADIDTRDDSGAGANNQNFDDSSSTPTIEFQVKSKGVPSIMPSLIPRKKELEKQLDIIKVRLKMLENKIRKQRQPNKQLKLHQEKQTLLEQQNKVQKDLANLKS